MSLLRKACFTIINGQPDDANAAPQTYRNPELVAYTKSFCRKIETRKDEDSDDLNDSLRTHDRESNVGDSQQEFEANDSPKNDSNETNKKDEAVLPMDKCVKLLEPHLVGFRKKYEGTLTKEPTGDATDDITDFIPQQLIRMTRFFPFKWIPLKLALLRSPSRDEIEVGGKIRLLLARALQKKGLLAAADLKILTEAFQGVGNGSKIPSATSRKRPRENDELYDRLRTSFSCLPSDPNASIALDHLKSVLRDYCQRLKDSKPTGTNDNDELALTGLPGPLQVADWALVSFSGLVMFNGIDHPSNENSECFVTESKYASLLFDESEHPKTMSQIVAAVDERMKQIMNPPSINLASDQNILCLARLLSYLPRHRAGKYIFSSIHLSFKSGGAVALTSLPRLLACYCSINLSRNPSTEYLPCLEKTIIELGERSMISLQEHNILKREEKEVIKLRAFIRLLFQNSNYLLES